MPNLQNFGANGGGGEIFSRNHLKDTSFLDFMRFKPLIVQICSRVFFSRRAREKSDTTKSQRGYISLICGEFPTQPNSTKIGICIGVADVMNHTKFGNDRSREYKVMEGRILPCLIGIRNG